MSEWLHSPETRKLLLDTRERLRQSRAALVSISLKSSDADVRAAAVKVEMYGAMLKQIDGLRKEQDDDD